ncbi:MAG: hypothetical protein E3J64_05480, partial [Anaerolineales bacterium]
MRRIVSLLSEIRKLQLKNAGAPESKLAEVGGMFNYFDSALNGVMVNGMGFDGPESKLGEVMTSADFTYAIQEFVQRQMLPGYQQVSFPFEPLVKPETLPNYLSVTRYQNRCGTDDLEWTGEKGEPSPGSVQDATKRQFKVEVWQKQFDFSMRTLVNDDIGYFEDTASKFGRSARRTLEKFVSRMYTNGTSITALALGALYTITGRLTSSRVSTARMGFNQRTDACGERIVARLAYIVHHSGLVDTVRVIRASQLIPELAT